MFSCDDPAKAGRGQRLRRLGPDSGNAPVVQDGVVPSRGAGSLIMNAGADRRRGVAGTGAAGPGTHPQPKGTLGTKQRRSTLMAKILCVLYPDPVAGTRPSTLATTSRC